MVERFSAEALDTLCESAARGVSGMSEVAVPTILRAAGMESADLTPWTDPFGRYIMTMPGTTEIDEAAWEELVSATADDKLAAECETQGSLYPGDTRAWMCASKAARNKLFHPLKF